MEHMTITAPVLHGSKYLVHWILLNSTQGSPKIIEYFNTGIPVPYIGFGTSINITPTANNDLCDPSILHSTHADRTTHLGEEDFKENNPFLILSRYLSNAGLKLVFGESMQASKEKADEAARLRPVHLLTVYFTTNEFDQLAMIASLWKDIPCRLIQLQPNDFFTEEQGRYDTMGIDRLATLRCAGSTFGFPVLVIDGGTCLTHTSADENGKIIGGGISFGYGAQLHSIVNRIDSVALDTNVLMKEANAMLAKCQELDPFPQNTVHAVLTDVMGGISTNLRRVIKQYVKRVGSPEGMEDDGITPKARHVVIVGGDEATISDLLNQALAIDQNARPQTVRAFDVALDAVLETLAIV